ncbi:JAB domain-containing protein [Marinilongibacter aquaticus]|uniref:JAB domain-containing protein n=1 Tax=Marinilongibacter aquaticus TaxID=2975157 RepID=UPI0021BDD417|nr:JAB domain-containing protein [Marinilongibacter aquaticus]UBM60800.1 JAB domain-containing protein [Marinilongibacter aquaticus]
MDRINSTVFSTEFMELRVSAVRRGTARISLNSPQRLDVAFRPFFSDCMDDHEEVWVLCMDSELKPLCVSRISSGGLYQSLVPFRYIIRAAVLSNARAVAIAHNHPSGRLQPSREDREFARRLEQAAELFDIRLLDSLILSSEGHYSFRDQGLLN